LVIVLVAIALSVAIFLGLRTETGSASLAAMAETAVPLDVALENGKPSLMEFYADWCLSCQAMAGDLESLKQEYGDRVNFVMLNVDNTKWLPEMLNYQVDGIPHFVFLNGQGAAIATTIGEQPRAIFAANLDALMADKPLPYSQNRGQMSEVALPTAADESGINPRSHGS
jgi:thiol-disulfide isomerase/thioredoxin